MFQRPRGTRDFSPEEMAGRRWALGVLQNVALRHGFREIQLPTFEELELFTKKSGPGIVEELYAFKDKGGRDLALRPEMTAQVMRFYVNDLSKRPKPLKLFYFGPCFRYENPQAGRFREFFQFGAEIIGSKTPETDAEAISLAYHQLRALGFNKFDVRIGFIGIYRELLRRLKLSDQDSAIALHLLDKGDVDGFRRFAAKCKVPEKMVEHTLSLRECKGGPEVLETVSIGPARDYLAELVDALTALGVDRWQIDLGIIRGLDYYTGMVFEIDAPGLGAEKQICGGGSYDLVPLFGGEEDVFTTGFALGFDRVLLALEKEDVKIEDTPLEAYVIAVGETVRKKSLEITNRLRESGISADFDSMRRSLSKALKYASLVGARYAVIVGEKELLKGVVTIRDMRSGEQKEVGISELVGHLRA
jgi:histidyl-tRNA synthetase